MRPAGYRNQGMRSIDLSRAGSILVFRALVLGDLLCATPALRALRRAAPAARITLCGLPWARDLATRLDSVDDFLEFPGHPELPERRVEQAELDRFVEGARERRYDLALQMHGSGGIVNPLVTSLAAKECAGFALPGTEGNLDVVVPWPESGSEIDRCLALPKALGAATDGRALDFPLTAADRNGVDELCEMHGVPARFVIVHPGSQLPSRRWPASRFAAVADSLTTRGLQVVITGSAAEGPLAQEVCAGMTERHRKPIDLTGETRSLWLLGELVRRARLVVANDTGISHIAAALGTPSLIVASGSDVSRWSPFDTNLHRVHWHDVPCRPCAHSVCPTEHECAAGVSAREVTDAAHHLLERI